MDAQDTVPYEIFIQQGGEEVKPSVLINTHATEVAEGADVTLTAVTVPAAQTVTWSSSDTSVATVVGGVVTGVAEGNAIITATITVDGVTYSDTCTVIVSAE